jgi:hypoxanthine phosphoribosyltransferase
MDKRAVSLEDAEKIIDEFVAANKEFLAGVDFIVGMSRGGLIPAALLSAQIDKPLIAVYINKQDEIFFDRPDWINGKNVLVVDDVVRSGNTLWLLKKYLENNAAAKTISFFTLFKVKSLADKKFDLPVFSRDTDENVVFPWDYDRL